MNKEKKIILIILSVLLLLIVLFTLINMGSITNIGDEKIDGAILFKYKEKGYIINFEQIEKLKSEKFDAVINTSTRKNKKVEYTAVKLTDILISIGIDYKEVDKAIVRAEDAYTSSVSVDDISKNDNVYIAYKMNDKYLKSREKVEKAHFSLL